MNINNAIAATPVKLPVSVPVPTKIEQEVKAAAVKPERILTGAEKFAKEFYTKEEEPWKKMTNTDYSMRIPTNREEYVEGQYHKSFILLGKQHKIFNAFMEELHFMDPDVAVKNWSYTLGPDGEVKVLDPKGNLTEAETDRLTEAMNKFKEFKSNIQDHAKTIMRIVDHDTEKFGGKYDISLLNFHTIIDYGIMNFIKTDRNDDWESQIYKNAETRDHSLIDVKA
ncbi:hypothetical protein [Pseudomonas viridiflava]|uniref:hypothetical protein n=1 Tax=Pseudomonas viridiflava TaxID=33069 RepID=UPI000F0544E0|nr:hypothetical protein [Pseudomonas viridiflava]